MQAERRDLVLVVDDHTEILESVSAYLMQRGFEVLTSSSPIGVSSLVHRHRPAVVVLDVMMPALDGGALAKLIRDIGSAQRTSIVFYSSMEEEQLYRISRDISGTSYVLKSDGLAALHAAVCRAIAAAGG